MMSKVIKKSPFTISLFLLILVYVLLQFQGTYNRPEIPDFCQGDKRYGNLPYKGEPYCGPTAVSNILVYLDKRDFLNLLPAENPDGFAQFNLIRLLGTEKYMNTMLKTGTEPIDLMYGLEKFVNEQGYKIKIKWRGSHYGGNYSIGEIPDIEWLHKELKENNFAILHIGWYTHNPQKDFYRRIGGHYVTVVGSKGDGLIIHDPAVRSGTIPKDEYCTFKKLKSGILSSWQSYKERPAIGYSKLEGIKVRKDADAAIVDGVVVFKLRKN